MRLSCTNLYAVIQKLNLLLKVAKVRPITLTQKGYKFAQFINFILSIQFTQRPNHSLKVGYVRKPCSPVE